MIYRTSFSEFAGASLEAAIGIVKDMVVPGVFFRVIQMWPP
jgi:hypothetical protein